MGTFFSCLFGDFNFKDSKVGILPEDLGPDADVPDPVTTLTKRDVAYIHYTWDLVRPDLSSHGVKFFLLLFETHPFLQNRFKGFVGKSLDDLMDNARLKAHATTVFSALNSYITNLEDVTTVVEMLKSTGVNHRNRRIPMSDFESLSPVLLSYLKEGLHSIWTPEIEKSWKKLLGVVLSVISSAYDKE